MPNKKPFVAAALACEKLLVEKDEVLSAIRIVDTYFIKSDLPESASAGPPVLTNIVIALKNDAPLQGEVSIAINTPNGETKEIPQKWPISFSEEISGANLLVALGIDSRHIGWTWVDVFWSGELLTKIPIRLVAGEKPDMNAPRQQKND